MLKKADPGAREFVPFPNDPAVDPIIVIISEGDDVGGEEDEKGDDGTEEEAEGEGG